MSQTYARASASGAPNLSDVHLDHIDSDEGHNLVESPYGYAYKVPETGLYMILGTCWLSSAVVQSGWVSAWLGALVAVPDTLAERWMLQDNVLLPPLGGGFFAGSLLGTLQVTGVVPCEAGDLIILAAWGTVEATLPTTSSTLTVVEFTQADPAIAGAMLGGAGASGQLRFGN